MNRREFERIRAPHWVKLNEALSELEKRKSSTPVGDLSEVPRLFREVCRDLALARHRMYGGRITDYLNELVMRGYKVLHKRKEGNWEGALNYIFKTIPQAVRENALLFWVTTLTFVIPYLLVWASAWVEIAWIQSILGAEGMRSMEQMYGKEDTIAHLRSKFGSNFAMFAFYIMNNVGIDFRIFASGVFFGVGSLFFLLFNGVYIGAAAGYVHYAGDPQKFYTFVVGHSSWELVGMVLAGMAGFILGLSLLKTGRMSIRDSLAAGGKKALPLIIGGAMLTVIAAVVEGFWSAQAFPPHVKYIFGAFSWLLVVAYLTLSGRRFSNGS